MKRRSDLSPPLGWMGGPCKVVDRIEDRISDIRLQDNLAHKVERGHKLTNQEAAKIYPVISDRGGGLFKAIRISSHAQFRMDQRAITVGDIRVALMNFSKRLNDWKSRDAWEWRAFEQRVRNRESIDWVDARLGGLHVSFLNDRGTAIIITTFWAGHPDPRPEFCRLAGIQPERSFGVQTWVKDPTPSHSDTGKPEGTDGKYPTRALPDPPWATPKNSPNPIFNVPGESGSDSSGTVHKDKQRTQGRPGGQYEDGATHPLGDITDSKITPKRRYATKPYKPRFTSPHPTSQQRQRTQKSKAKRYDAKRYRRTRGKALARGKRRYKRLKNNHVFQRKRSLARNKPERHKRKPGGGVSTLAERSRRYRKNTKQSSHTVSIPFFHYPSEEWGVVTKADLDGTFHVQWDEGNDQDVVDIETFFEETVIDDESMSKLVTYLDDVFEHVGDTSISEDASTYDDTDLLFEAWLEKQQSRVQASFYREVRPPDMDPDTRYDRANDHDHRNRRDRIPGDAGFLYEDAVMNSNPGSRVLPTGKGHIQREAARMREIRDGCAQSLLEKSVGLSVKLVRVDPKNAIWAFDVAGSSDNYRVRIKAIRKGNITDIKKVHVKVSCSCPFWQWQGPEYHAKQNDYLYGLPRGLATKPDVKDPNGQHRACKHLLAVFDYVADKPGMVRPKLARCLIDAVCQYRMSILSHRVANRYFASMR